MRSLTDPTEGNPFPAAGDFQYPNSPPPTYNQFFNNRPQEPLNLATEGNVYKADVKWLLWNTGQPPSPQTLATSLEWPGNSTNYADNGDATLTQATPNYPHIVRGYVHPLNALDTSLNKGDFVANNNVSGTASEVADALNQHIDREGRTLRLVVYDQVDGAGATERYRVSGFIVAKIRGYNLAQGWILIEFVRADNSCGQ